MGDIKLFRVFGESATELEESSVAVEKSLQNLTEKHLETLLGIRFLASEYSTGKTHGGRLDTLGIDENYCPVVIEYKRSINENVITQGLFYLDWLMDHKAEFEMMVLKKFDQESAQIIEWSSPRLLCIAGDFTKYDEYAVEQIDRNIELIRYRLYGKDLLLLELLNATTSQKDIQNKSDVIETNGKTMPERYLEKDEKIKDIFESLKAFLLALGDDVQFKSLKVYFAFKRIKNFACVEIHPGIQKIKIYVKVNPLTIDLEPGFTKDVSGISHWGTGDLEISIGSKQDLERAKPLLIKSYEAN